MGQIMLNKRINLSEHARLFTSETLYATLFAREGEEE